MEQLNGKGFILNYFVYSLIIKEQEQNEADTCLQALVDIRDGLNNGDLQRVVCLCLQAYEFVYIRVLFLFCNDSIRIVLISVCKIDV